MRDKNRIDPFMKKLTTIWKEKCPDWRFGQLISNLEAYIGHDIFHLEDDDFMEYIKTYFNE